MTFDHSISMASIHNVIVALNQGGMLTCRELATRITDDLASSEQITDKIQAARRPSNRTPEYMEQQLRQEVRRSLYSHFNDPTITGFDVYRATAHGDSERFWVAEEQVIVEDLVEVASELLDNIEDLLEDAGEQAAANREASQQGLPVELPDNASLFDRLSAGLSVTGDRETLTIRFPSDTDFDVATEVVAAVNDEFEGQENTAQSRRNIARRVDQLLTELEAQ